MLITLKLWEMSNESVPSLFRKQAATRKNKNAFLIDDKSFTFQEVWTVFDYVYSLETIVKPSI